VLDRSVEEKVYGLDMGGRRFWISVNGAPSKPWTAQQFLDFEWFEGGGILVSESSTYVARPKDGVPSMAQPLYYDEWQEFQQKARINGLRLFKVPHRLTRNYVNTWVELVENRDPRVSRWHDAQVQFKQVNGKHKDDANEAVVIGWIADFDPRNVHPVKIKDPDQPKDKKVIYREKCVQSVNKRLNSERVTKDYADASFKQFNQDNLKYLVNFIKEKAAQGHAIAIDAINYDYVPKIYTQKNKQGKWNVGDVNINSLIGIYHAVYSHMVDADGNRNPGGWGHVKRCLGFNGFRHKSGVAGAQVHHDFLKTSLRKKILKKYGLEDVDGKTFYTRDPESKYFQLRKEANSFTRRFAKLIYEAFDNVVD
jgi:hypothetical protein